MYRPHMAENQRVIARRQTQPRLRLRCWMPYGIQPRTARTRRALAAAAADIVAFSRAKDPVEAASCVVDDGKHLRIEMAQHG
jgi:hypothetical protein